MGTKVQAAPARRRAKQVGSTVAIVGVAAGLVLGTVSTAKAAIPDSATRVAVAEGAATQNVDAHLEPAAAISGALTALTGGQPLDAGTVGAYRNGKLVRSGFVLGGEYTIRGLEAGSYAVCADGAAVFGGPSTTGYLGRCFGGAAFDGRTVPSGATLVTVANGQSVTGKDVALPSGGAIAGKVTTSGGAALRNVLAYAWNRSTHRTYFGFTDATGRYAVTGLPASSTGYAVCFSPVPANVTGTGWQARCYRNVAWTGAGTYPAAATKIAVTPGRTTGNVNQALPAGGAIAGTVTDGSTRKPVKGDTVIVFSSGGAAIGSTTTDAKGRFTVRGLAAASGDRVCAAPLKASPSTTYAGRCWKTIAYRGGKLPSGTKAVAVKASRTTGGINLALPRTVIKLGSIAGRITDHAGNPLTKASVVAYTTTGAAAGSTTTAADGSYRIANLRASSTGYVVCARQNSSTTASVTPQFGWAPRCSADVAWIGVGLPAGAKRWTIGGSAPWIRTGVNIALHDGGAITGTTYVGSDLQTGNVTVKLFTSTGKQLASVNSDFAGGTYSFTGLTAGSGSSGYVVCFDGRDDFVSPQGYRPQCFDGTAWDGNA